MNTLKAELGVVMEPAPVARVQFIGLQGGADGMDAFALYNILSGPGLCVGSTVTRQSLEAKGFRVEVVNDAGVLV